MCISFAVESELQAIKQFQITERYTEASFQALMHDAANDWLFRTAQSAHGNQTN